MFENCSGSDSRYERRNGVMVEEDSEDSSFSKVSVGVRTGGF